MKEEKRGFKIIMGRAQIADTQSFFTIRQSQNLNIPADTARVDTTTSKQRIEVFSSDSLNVTDTLPIDSFKQVIGIGGTKDSEILKNAPNPQISVKGKTHNAVIVVDTKENRLYKYDNSGKVQKAYKVSTGRENSPTNPGVYSIGWVEKYPYNTAGESTLRKNVPDIFGDRPIALYVVDEKNGTKKNTGIMIHGCWKDSDIGGNWSGGCVRMYNPDILDIASSAQKELGKFIKVQ